MALTDTSANAAPQPDAFDLLGLEPSAALGIDTLEQAFRSRAEEQHPDSGGQAADSDSFAALSAARDALRSPAQRLDQLRLRHAAGAVGATDSQRRTVTLNQELNRLFPVVGAALDEARQTIARRDGAQSDLARALVTPELLKARQQLIDAQEQLRATLQTMEAGLSALDDELNSVDAAVRARAVIAVADLQGQFACLERWQHQLRQQTAACMF